MAERRMFTKKVTDDDHFLALSASAQALYLHLSMSADDDGFCNQVSASMFKAHASVQDLQALAENRYIYQFESGVIVIKHWFMANAIRKDRYHATAFQRELAQLQKRENGAYTLPCCTNGNQMATTRQPNGNQMATEVRLGKVSLGEDNISLTGDNARARTREEKPVKHRYGEYKNVLLTDDELEKLKERFPQDWERRIEDLSLGIESKGYKYKSHYAAILSWARRDEARKPSPKQGSAEELDDFYRMVADWAKEDDG